MRERRKMEVKYFRKYEKGCTKGFFTLYLEGGMVIKDMTYMKKEDNAWVSFPSKQYKDKDGNMKWTNIVYFSDKTDNAEFQDAILPLVEEAFDAAKN